MVIRNYAIVYLILRQFETQKLSWLNVGTSLVVAFITFIELECYSLINYLKSVHHAQRIFFFFFKIEIQFRFKIERETKHIHNSFHSK